MFLSMRLSNVPIRVGVKYSRCCAIALQRSYGIVVVSQTYKFKTSYVIAAMDLRVDFRHLTMVLLLTKQHENGIKSFNRFLYWFNQRLQKQMLSVALHFMTVTFLINHASRFYFLQIGVNNDDICIIYTLP